MQLIHDRTQEIKKELAELHNTLKMSVQKAIRIGQLLTEQKEFLGHGNFLPWLNTNFDMGERTAQKYMALFRYQDKTALNADLQTAYLQIETLEKQERLSKEERDRSMIAEFRKTGEKPAGWTAKHDKAVKDTDEHLAKQNERLEKEKKDREGRAREYRESSRPTNASSGVTFSSDALKVATENFLAKSQERTSWKEKIRLSDGGKDDAFNDAIIDYLETLENDNRRIEACNNIIKICRNISVELQRGSNHAA